MSQPLLAVFFPPFYSRDHPAWSQVFNAVFNDGHLLGMCRLKIWCLGHRFIFYLCFETDDHVYIKIQLQCLVSWWLDTHLRSSQTCVATFSATDVDILTEYSLSPSLSISQLLKNVTISQGGVLPNIQEVLLIRKNHPSKPKPRPKSSPKASRPQPGKWLDVIMFVSYLRINLASSKMLQVPLK